MRLLAKGSSLVSRFRELSEFEAELDFQLANPDRFGSKKVREHVENLLVRHAELIGSGPVGDRISDKNKMLGLIFRRTIEKQELVLISDNKTFVKVSLDSNWGNSKN